MPAIKGGAVETLMQLLIDHNEKSADFHFDIFSIANTDAEQAAGNYKNAFFHYVDINSPKYLRRARRNKFINKFTRRLRSHHFPEPLYEEVAKFVNHEGNIDAILLEGVHLPADYLARKTGVKIIQRIHNTRPVNLGSFDINAARSTDLYIGISNFICNYIREVDGHGCQNIELLYNAIDNSTFNEEISSKDIAKLRADNGVHPDDFIIFFAGRLSSEKGIDKLIEAMQLIPDNNVKLLIAGSSFFSCVEETPFTRKLRLIAEPVKDRILFAGYVNHDEIHKYYKSADLCVLPSVWEEPFALTCLEAITCGCPVIITRSGGMPEIIDDRCAIVVENDEQLVKNLAEKIIFCRNNPTMLAEMSKNALERAKIFADDIHYSRFVELIEKYT